MFEKELAKIKADRSGKKPQKKKKKKPKSTPKLETVKPEEKKHEKKAETKEEEIIEKTDLETKEIIHESETEHPFRAEPFKEEEIFEKKKLEIKEVEQERETELYNSINNQQNFKKQIINDEIKMTIENKSTPLIKFESNASAPILRYDLPSPSSYEGRNYIELDLHPEFFKEETDPNIHNLINEFFMKNNGKINTYLTNISAEELQLDLYQLLKVYDIPVETPTFENIQQAITNVVEETPLIAGIAISVQDESHYWFLNGTYYTGTHSNASIKGPYSYSLPPGKDYSDIAAIGIAYRMQGAERKSRTFFWYKDGTVSYGKANDADAGVAPYTCTFPAGKSANDLVGVGISNNNNIIYWYNDGTRSKGTSRNASVETPAPYTLATGKNPNDVLAIGIKHSNNFCYYWYKDGTVSSGSSTVGDSHSHGTVSYTLPAVSIPTDTTTTQDDQTDDDITDLTPQEEFLLYEKKSSLFKNYVQLAFSKGKLIPSFYRSMSGNLKLKFGKIDMRARMFLIETLKLTSFPGDYGAGSVIKTFSLLPKEKTKISVKTWKKSSQTSKEASSILDSYTEDKADEFETSVQTENANASKVEESNAYSIEASADVSWTGGNVSVSGSYEGSTNSQREQSAKTIVNSLEKHAQKASAKREVNIDTSYETTDETGEEILILREIENLNASRTLNFIFRQMNQEYHSLLHLYDIRIGYYSGIPGTMLEYGLNELDRFAINHLNEEVDIADVQEDFIQNDKINENKIDGENIKSSQLINPKNIIEDIIREAYTQVHDYNGDIQSLIEEVNKSDNFGKPYKYFRVKPPKEIHSEGKIEHIGQQVYVLQHAEGEKPYNVRYVDGIIIQKKVVTMKTDGVIVESLLGTANALDDYAIKSQNEDVREQKYKNNKIKLALKIINALIEEKNYSEAIRAYKEFFGVKEGLKLVGELFSDRKLSLD